ncbi:MAG TPA: rhomboid family intramembrane serine protease, partial [Candidatus Eisenbacteria bacterium]|nr:rhomboid family intramembrane serine protease [Candidatus Eisenbacteria bacterium]
MIPLRDDIPARQFPAATLGIIVLNVLVFLHELKLGRHLNDLLLAYAIIPARYTYTDVAQQFTVVEQIIPFFASMFLHGGWLHLIGNMWTLWIFGDNVEDRLGRGKYLGLYLLSGFAASLLHIFTNAGSGLPTIGA